MDPLFLKQRPGVPSVKYLLRTASNKLRRCTEQTPLRKILLTHRLVSTLQKESNLETETDTITEVVRPVSPLPKEMDFLPVIDEE